jgi:hypothetical protein
MRRGIPFVLTSLALVVGACGARTGLGVELTEGGELAEAGDAQSEGDALFEAEVGVDQSNLPDVAPLGLCPLSPPSPTDTCPTSTKNTPILCGYVPTPEHIGINVWECASGLGWFPGRTPATRKETCSQIVCTANVTAECVIGGGSQCCVCSADGRVVQCGPC